MFNNDDIALRLQSDNLNSSKYAYYNYYLVTQVYRL